MQQSLLKRALYIFFNLAVLALIFFSLARVFEDFSIDRRSLKRSGGDEEKNLAQEKKPNLSEDLASKTPNPEGLVERKFEWRYKGSFYSISHELYQSIYDFYRSQPKSYTYFNELPAGWEEDYYGMFVLRNDKYNFAKKLADELVTLGKKKKLSDDQIVELIVSFVQSIPYDDQKAANIISKVGSEKMSYPYETLFENKGVCSDKSFLAYALLREIGYGVAIFVYDKENHMSIGIQCTEKYSSYGSGYCYVETTSIGNKIGIIPDISSNAGRAMGAEEIAYFTENSNQGEQTISLGQAKIFQKTVGREYAGIIQTIKTNEEIMQLKKWIDGGSSELKALKLEITKAGEELSDLEKRIKKYLEDRDIDKYNEVAKRYNEKLEDYDEAVKEYNALVKQYNEKVARYNHLIKS